MPIERIQRRIDQLLDEAGRERVKREAQALGRLGSHPNIVTVFELGEEDARPYLVTELLPGGDLAKLIAEAPDHRLPLPRVLELATAISAALAFAHGKGVIHRDLKPSNVWLAEDGTPKLGDFGLATSLTDPRLTQAGMMVGTALYMAPEQATGGDVTPKSDLYSLGCLLYELVCGRPPFAGDESVVIIGQQLSMNPVSPTWHRPDCPKPLDALLLHLLEKDPSLRPSSAQAVVVALAAISPIARRTTSESRQQLTAPSGAASIGGPGAQSPVYRRIFVGREAELKQLEEAFDAAAAGQGGLVMIVGEPGIGKTTLTEQLATYASLRGGRTLVGHCYEEGSLSLPYLPFVEAMRTYVLDHEPGKLRSELGSAAPKVARLVSEVRDRVQIQPSADAGGEDRYRLLQAVCSFLRNAAAAQPLVLVLADLHDADRGTLDLLQFLARQLAGARLLVAGTYRDVEVDRTHPLSATLAELRRSANFSRVLLRGLTADEVQRMLAAVAGQDVPRGLAEGVHRQTEGNPLFVQEVLRYLAEEGLITREGGRWQRAGERSLLETIPEGLRDVIGKRLGRLSAECNRVLTVAAVVGREFALQTLQAVAGMPDDELVAALEEAVKVAVLQDVSRPGSVRYRFTHAFFRQTLYEEIITPRRLRLHQQVARALEQQYAARLQEHAAELADHFAQSSDPAELAKAVQYGRLAANRARAVYAHGEAVRLLEQALAVQEVADPDDTAERCALLLELGEALLPTGEMYRAAKEVSETAYGLAERLADHPAMLRACRTGVLGMMAGGAGPAMGTPTAIRWTERLDALAQQGTAERAIADASRAWVCFAQRRYGEMGRLALQALATARVAGDEEALWTAGFSAITVWGPQDYEASRLPVAAEFAVREPYGVSAVVYGLTLVNGGMALLSWGRRQEAETAFRRLAALAEQTKEALLQVFAPWVAGYLLRIDGRLKESIDLAEQARRLAEELGIPDVGVLTVVLVAHRSRALLGHIDDEMLNALYRPYAVYCLALLGRDEEARTRLLQLLRELRIDDEESRIGGADAAALLEGALLLGEAGAAQRLARHLDLVAAMSAAEFVGPCIARLLGGAAALNGDRERALAYYAQALETAGRIGYRPEIALTHLGLAEHLRPLSPNSGGTSAEGPEAERGLDAAREHLDFAVREFEAMGMQPALVRARRLQATLSGVSALAPTTVVAAADPHAPPPAQPGQVFISYSSADRPTAFALADRLEAERVPVWIDRRSIPAGESWDAEIVKGIRACALVAVLVSPKAMTSKNVRQELRLALQYDKPVLPLLLAPTTYPGEVEYVLAGRQWIEVMERPADEWFAQVRGAVRRLA